MTSAQRPAEIDFYLSMYDAERDQLVYVAAADLLALKAAALTERPDGKIAGMIVFEPAK